MWFPLIQNIVISFLIIFIIHNVFVYLKDTYTVKKTKDLTEIQTKKFKAILDEINTNNENDKMDLLRQIEERRVLDESLMNNPIENDTSNIIKNDLSEVDLKLMNDDLESFIQNEMTTTRN